MAPSESQKQQQFMGAELSRLRSGQKTRTGMSESQLRDFARTKRRGLPSRKPRMRAGMRTGGGR